MRRNALAVLIATCAWLAGCSESREAGLDASPIDGSSLDASGSEDASSATDASAVDASSSGACGTRGGAPCPDGQACIFPEGSCGADDLGGTCTVPPDACPEIFMPVCGCDGVTYENTCAAHAAGASIARTGACDAVSCDRRQIMCRRAEPACPEGQTAEVVDNCYGDCVPIDSCVCIEAEACPNPDRYTCHMFRQRCGPYL